MRYCAQLCEITRAWLVVSGKQQADNAAAWAAYYQQQGYYGGQPQAQPQPYQQPQQSPSQPASTPGKFNCYVRLELRNACVRFTTVVRHISFSWSASVKLRVGHVRVRIYLRHNLFKQL